MRTWDEIQSDAVASVLAAIQNGERRILLAMPTGLGKTRVARYLIEHYLRLAKRCSMYSNRKMLVEQTSGVMDRAGVDHGVRMAGAFADLDQRFQISSLQTDSARVVRKKSWSIHPADLVVLDEAHLNKGPQAQEIIRRHEERNPECVTLGLSATPLDLAHIYTRLIQAATLTEGRECGALVRADHYGPDEPDLRHIGRVEVGKDLSENQIRSAMGKVEDGKPNRKLVCLFGRVLDWWVKLHKPASHTILFAPGVGESLWFAEQFYAAGYSAAHIDGDNIWLDGEFYESSPNMREEVRQGSMLGRIKVVTNRFVMREGIDWPWLSCGLLATVFGSLQSYIQSGGRLLRAHAGKERALVLDFGGNWHKHGSLNADRHWNLEDTPQRLAALREERLRAKEEVEPFRCPECGQILTRSQCPCGFTIDLSRKSRPVVQEDGVLKHYWGDIYKPRPARMEPDTQDLWRKMYYRARNGGMTFRQAEALFYVEQGYFPPRDLPLMPRGAADWCAKVADVPYEELR